MREDELLPWRKAITLQDCFLYWLPVNTRPMRHFERTWTLDFLARFSAALKEQHALRCENFLRVQPMSQAKRTTLQTYALTSKLLPGVCRKPGAPLQGTPQPEDAENAKAQGKSVDVQEWTRDFCYWFQNKKPVDQWDNFWGDGAMSCLFLAPDGRTAPPPLNFPPAYRRAFPAFQAFDVDSIVEGAYALHDGFLAKSKKVFGHGLENNPMERGIMYVLPILETHHFLTLSPEERAACFEVFDVYLTESPEEKGLVLAFQKPLEPVLIDVLKGMRADGLDYGGKAPASA